MQANPDLVANLGGASVADALLAVVHRSGTRHLFAMPGESLNPIMEAVRKHADVTLLTVRHEGYGALMASAYAKLSGRLGVCLGVAGPGTTHLVLGVYDAAADGAPVLAVSGQIPHSLMGACVFQEIDAVRLFASIAHSSQLVGLRTPVRVIHHACNEALSRSMPTHVSVPADVLRSKIHSDESVLVDQNMLVAALPQISTELIGRAVDQLTRSERRLIVVGDIDPGAHKSILVLAKVLDAPIAILPEGIRVGVRDAGGSAYPVVSEPTSKGRQLCAEAHTVLALGGVRRVLAELLSPRAAVIEVAAPSVSSLDGAGFKITGNMAEILELLCTECATRAALNALPAPLIAKKMDQAKGMPELWRAINAAWPADGVLSLEPGAVVDGALQHLVVNRRRVTSSFNAGLRGYAIPGSIGAACALPKCAALAVTTFDGFSESMAELLTIAKYELPITVLCLIPDGELAFDAMDYARSCDIDASWAPDKDALERALGNSLLDGMPHLIAAPAALAQQKKRVVAVRRSWARPRRDTFATRIADALAQLGVKRVYGKLRPENKLLVAAIDQHSDMRFIAVQHPESAAMMASAVAKTLVEPTVCIATDDAECILQLNGLYDAGFDAAPVLFLAPQPKLNRNNVHQGLNVGALLGEVACWQGAIHADARIGASLAVAVNQAARNRGVAVLTLTWDDLARRQIPPLPEWLHPPSLPTPFLPPRDAVRDAARRLLASPRVLIIAGRGAQGAAAELIALSELLHAPIATTMPGRGSVPDSYHRFIGGIGSSGHRAATDALMAADLVLALGHSVRGALFEARHGAYTIRVDCDVAQLGVGPSVSLPLHGDVKLTLASLLARLREKPIQQYATKHAQRLRAQFAEEHQHAFSRWLVNARRIRQSKQGPIQPSEICHTLERLLERSNHRAVVTVDVGVTTLWVYRHFVGNHDRVWTSSFGTMGFAVPAAIAVAERRQHAGPVIAIVGDGGICITLSELATARRLGVVVTAIVFNNGKLAAVKYEQEVMGWPEFGTKLHNADFAAYARSCGLNGLRVTALEMLEEYLDNALSSKESSLVDVVCDPHELPVPPRVHPLQGAGYFLALARETTERLKDRVKSRRATAVSEAASRTGSK